MELARVVDNVLNQLSLKTTTVVALGVFAAVTLGRWISTELKIQKLGGHAPKLKTRFPFGMRSLLCSLSSRLTFLLARSWLYSHITA